MNKRPITQHNRNQKLTALTKILAKGTGKLVYYGTFPQVGQVKRQYTRWERITRRAALDLATVLERPCTNINGHCGHNPCCACGEEK